MTLEQLDRTFFEAIHSKIIEGGHYVDKRNYTNAPDFNQALKDLLASKGQGDQQLIYLFGTGPSEKRDEIKTTKIVIDRASSSPGEVGAFPETALCKNDDGTFDKTQLPRSSEDILYEIRIITSSIKYERICQQIIYDALGSHTKYLTTTNGEHIEIMRDGFNNVSATRFIEVIIKYTAKNAFLESDNVIATGIKPIIEIVNKSETVLDSKIIDIDPSINIEFQSIDKIKD